MPKAIDLTGMRFGRLTVISQSIIKGNCGQIRWNCVCDCGTENTASTGTLRTGHSQSCGCLHKERMKEVHSTHGHNRKGKKSLTYNTWAGIIQRCMNINNRNYRHYGGRGIKVCERWESFSLFLDDVGERPSLKHELDRINNDGDYEVGNVRWVTRQEQMRNTRITNKDDVGVYFENQTKKWRAKIRHNGNTLGLGRFKIKEDAIAARKQAEIKYWGKESPM